MISLWLCFDIILYLLCIFVCMQWCYYTVRDVYILTYISPLGWCDSSRSCTLKSTVTQSLFFSDCTWSVSHSNSVHCLTIYSNFSEYNVLLWLAWFRKEYTFLLWFSYSCFLITYFKHIELWLTCTSVQRLCLWQTLSETFFRWKFAGLEANTWMLN